MNDTSHGGSAAAGVEALIERLRDQGVAKGRAEAEKITAEAEQRADWILRQAREEADTLVRRARAEADKLKTAGEEALHIAMRDSVLKMREILSHRTSDTVRRLIRRELEQQAFLRQLILEVAGQVRQEAGIDRAERVRITLPRDVVGVDQLSRRPEELHEGSLTHFVLAVADEVLREGVTFQIGDDIDNGIKISLLDQNVEVELTDRQVAELLLQHLQPRLRAIMEGAVR